jgi:hypothetical protein
LAVLLVLLLACAPSVDGPVERQRASDREDGSRLSAQLGALPGVIRAEVVLRRAARDPLATAAPVAPAASLVVIVDDLADRAATLATARTLSRAIAPELEPTIVVEVGGRRPRLAKVGPFTVEAASRDGLRATLAIGLALLAALAAWAAWSFARQRRGSSAQ